MGDPGPCGPVRAVRRAVRARGPGARVRGTGAGVPRRLGRRGASGPGWTACSASTRAAPTPVSGAPRLSAELGVRVLFKREDLAHTGSHKINNVAGAGPAGPAARQDRAGRGDRRGPARGGHRHDRRAPGPGLHRVHGRAGHGAAGTERVPDGAAGRHGPAGVLRGPGRSRTPPPRRCGTGSPPWTPPTTASARCWDRTRIRGWCASSSGSSARRPAPSAPRGRTCCRPGGRMWWWPAWAAGRTRPGTFAGFADTPARLVGVEAAGGAAVSARAARRAARLPVLVPPGRARPGPRGRVGLGRAGLPGRRARARLPGRPWPCRVPHRDRRGGDRGGRTLRPAPRASWLRWSPPTRWPGWPGPRAPATCAPGRAC